MKRNRIPAPVLVIGLAAGMAWPACGANGSTTRSAGDERAGAAAGFPVTIENCGIETTYEAAPERAVVIYQHTTEIMLALGLADRMAGTAYMDSAIRDDLVDAYETVPVLADEDPSREQVLATEPDVVVAGWETAFTDESAGTRESLDELGIASYLTTGSCPDFSAAPSLDLVAEDITELGAIFGVPDRAADLVAEIEATVDDVTAALEGAEPVDVFVYDSGTGLGPAAGSVPPTGLPLAGRSQSPGTDPQSTAALRRRQRRSRSPTR